MVCPMFRDIKHDMTWHAFLGHPVTQPKWQRPKRLREDPGTECVSADSIRCGGGKSKGIKWLAVLRS